MTPKLVYSMGSIYLKIGDRLERIDPEKIEDICIIPLPRKEKDSNEFKMKMEKLKEKAKEEFARRREQDIKDVMQEHVAVVLHELVHAMYNHPNHKWPWKGFDFVHQTAVMMEEAGEAVRAANNMRASSGDQMALYNELAQTAAMCLRIMEQIKEYSVYGQSGD